MVHRSIRRMVLAGLAVVVALLLVAPAMAQEGEATHQQSMFWAFLKTDSYFGTALIWSCLFISIAVVSLIIQNVIHNRMNVFIPPDLQETLERLLAERNFREAIELVRNEESPFGQVMRAALNESPHGHAAMEMAIEDTADGLANRKVRNLIWLEIAGAAGPMIGLFGTVFGMILAFQRLVAAGGSPKAAELAGGIATALVCTFWGLIVGIPGVVTASLFRVRVEGLTAEVIARAKSLILSLRATRKPAAAAGVKAATPA